MKVIPSPDEVNNEDVADKEAAERKEVYKDKKGEIIDDVDGVRINELYSTLVKLQVWVLHLAEHDCLRTGTEK